MKIERHYPNRESLNQAEAPYNEALLVLNTLYMVSPVGGKGPLSTKDVIDFSLGIVYLVTKNRFTHHILSI